MGALRFGSVNGAVAMSFSAFIVEVNIDTNLIPEHYSLVSQLLRN